MTRHRARTSTAQLTLFRAGPGGARRGAGRKPRGNRALVPHVARPALSRHHPVHVTTRLGRGLPPLRRLPELEVLRRALGAGADRFGFRLVHFSIQNDHLHLIAEAEDARSLSRGMKGLLVRVARALNRLWRRHGQVFADRYHAHVLRTPREVRNALVYVLNNAKKHLGRFAGLDPASSAAHFDGWARPVPVGMSAASAPPQVAAARTWLLCVGWRRHGRIDPSEMPRARRA